ncbi:hypothetical protein ACHAW5_002585 [Stephanodiscus triporus]|uniref:Uncharacterized protein n=1 Tax=Stephanodiscus triporus TaxID=2934178 RepID=A0ABD3MEN5_9STRA
MLLFFLLSTIIISTFPKVGGRTGGDRTTTTTTTTTFVHPLAIASARLRAGGIDELSKAINLGGLVIGGEYFGLSNVVVDHRGTLGTAAGGAGVKRGGTSSSSSSSSSEIGGDDKGGKIRGGGGGGVVADQNSGVGSATSSSSSSSASADHSKSFSSSSSSAAAAVAADDDDDGATTTTTTMDETSALDARLRSAYVLRRRRSQYDSASSSLSRHSRRLSSSIAATRVLDGRIRELRRRWSLVAPEHGTSSSAGPVRPVETVAVDVEVYRRRGGGGGGGGGGHASLGRIARRVPRFATLELDDEYDISPDVKSLRARMKNVIDGLRRAEEVDADLASPVDMEADGDEDVRPNETTFPSPPPSSGGAEGSCKTKAEPFAVADPTLGKIDPDFDPEKVPLLTLLFEIEKPSTGFVERAALSSLFQSSANEGGSSGRGDLGGGGRHLLPDERVIEALQHSLFCASFFESIRADIIPPSAHSNIDVAAFSQQRQKSVAWLSSEMEESFLPPPSVMAGEDTSRTDDAQLLCVIHCHEGELKVQLNDEYSLTVKLIEAGTAAAVGRSNPLDAGAAMTSNTETVISGSQSPRQLRTLCRALLLHSQSLYHDHCTKTHTRSTSDVEKLEEKPPAGFARKKKETKPPSPHILHSCVSLGCKFIFEKKVRAVISRLSRWLESDMYCKDKIVVEWLSLSFFNPHSRFVLLFRDVCFDVVIHGDALRLTHTSCTNGFRVVGFGSDLELECFLKLEFRRALQFN